MLTINTKYENEIIIKNSKFITIILPFNNKEDFTKELENIKIKYPKATHYCYAYITLNDKKASDDKEPSGTAGRPILHVLEENELTNILCVVVRYFGGIKLGAGGLVRAYTKSVSDILKKSALKKLEKGSIIKLEISYDENKIYENLLKQEKILKTEYKDKIIKEIFIKDKTLKDLENKKIPFELLNKDVYM